MYDNSSLYQKSLSCKRLSFRMVSFVSFYIRLTQDPDLKSALRPIAVMCYLTVNKGW